MKLIFATNNLHKLEEVSFILGPEFLLITPSDIDITEDIPENEDTIEGNALAKAQYIHERARLDCFADDTGLEVNALDGEPGVRSARYAGEGHDFEANIDLLLEKLKDTDDRRARFRTVIALIMDGEEYLFEGTVYGEIIRERRGDGGFGYDSVFIPDGYKKTFAEMDPMVKNRISHRAEAVLRLKEFLENVK